MMIQPDYRIGIADVGLVLCSLGFICYVLVKIFRSEKAKADSILPFQIPASTNEKESYPKKSNATGGATREASSSLLDPAKRRVWCFGPTPSSKINNQRYYLPVRFLSILDSEDLIILPGNHEPTREFVNFVTPLLGISPDRIIWTSGDHFCLDDDIDEGVLLKLEVLMRDVSPSSGNSGWVLVPYSATTNFTRWSDKLRGLLTRGPSPVALEVFGESKGWIDRFGSKAMLHRHVARLNEPSVMEQIDPLRTIAVPIGFHCSEPQDLLEAYKLITAKTQDPRVVVKPIHGTAGVGIIFVDNAAALEKYDFPMGDVVLEEHLNLDMTDDDLIIAPAVHYFGGSLFGGHLVDQLMKETTYLGWRESKVSKEFEDRVWEVAEKLIGLMNPKGPGGFDFLSVNGKAILSDINTGRFNGAHQPKMFLHKYATPEQKWYCWKHKPKATIKIDTVWGALSDAGLTFRPRRQDQIQSVSMASMQTKKRAESNASHAETVNSTGSDSADDDHIPLALAEVEASHGVFPLTYLRGVEGLFIAIADTSEAAEDLYLRAQEVLESLEHCAL